MAEAVSNTVPCVTSSCQLEICAASYGLCDVTEKVKSLIKLDDQSLKFKVSNRIFGDTWRRHRKIFVIVYRYINTENSEIKKMIVIEGDSLEIRPDPETLRSDPPHSVSLSGQDASFSGEELQLKIVFAVYGLNDITSRAQGRVTTAREFDQSATDETWNDCPENKPWPARNKTLVVVYTCNGSYMVDIAVRGQRMHFAASPPLCILGAVYGVKCVTEKVVALVKNRSFSATVNDRTFEHRLTVRKKVLVVVYQYGDEKPMIATGIEGTQLKFQYSKNAFGRDRFSNCSTLTILGAAYGPTDVTDKVQGLVNVEGGDSLNVTADNGTFKNNWKGHRKTLVIVSRKRGGEPCVNAVRQGESIHLA